MAPVGIRLPPGPAGRHGQYVVAPPPPPPGEARLRGRGRQGPGAAVDLLGPSIVTTAGGSMSGGQPAPEGSILPSSTTPPSAEEEGEEEPSPPSARDGKTITAGSKQGSTQGGEGVWGFVVGLGLPGPRTPRKVKFCFLRRAPKSVCRALCRKFWHLPRRFAQTVPTIAVLTNLRGQRFFRPGSRAGRKTIHFAHAAVLPFTMGGGTSTSPRRG